MRVDVHTHYLPKSYRDLLREWSKPVRIEDRGGIPHATYHDSVRELSPGFRDLDARAEWMDRHDIDTTIASISNPSPHVGTFTINESVELVRAFHSVSPVS